MAMPPLKAIPAESVGGSNMRKIARNLDKIAVENAFVDGVTGSGCSQRVGRDAPPDDRLGEIRGSLAGVGIPD
jgi:hypothetical protein